MGRNISKEFHEPDTHCAQNKNFYLNPAPTTFVKQSLALFIQNQ